MLAVALAINGDDVVVRLRGDLDAASGSAVDEIVEMTLCLGKSRAIIDLSEVAFMDATGVGSLIRAKLTLSAAGAQLRVRGLHGQVRRVADLVDLDQSVDVEPSTEL
jgi:anti-sigma B factor antagonist